MPCDNIPELKKRLRQTVRAIIRGLSREHRIEQDTRLAKNFADFFAAFKARNSQSNYNLLGYMPLPDEPDISQIYRDLDHTSLVLPVSNQDGSLTLRYASSQVKQGLFGITEPAATARHACIEDIDLAIIPGRAFGKAGQRLGRGKGYYDRLLEKCSCITIGLCYDEQIFPNIPLAKHDACLKTVITPTHIYYHSDFEPQS